MEIAGILVVVFIIVVCIMGSGKRDTYESALMVEKALDEGIIKKSQEKYEALCRAEQAYFDDARNSRFDNYDYSEKEI